MPTNPWFSRFACQETHSAPVNCYPLS
jgi:hypothetical protein